MMRWIRAELRSGQRGDSAQGRRKLYEAGLSRTRDFSPRFSRFGKGLQTRTCLAG